MSIFDETNKLTGNWWKKEKIGDKIEGTYEGRSMQVNQMSGKDQNVYEIRKSNGELWLIGGNVGIDSQMQRVKTGQIVGFEFIEERKNKNNPALNPTKVVQVYANPTIVDEEWLAHRSKLGVRDEDDGREETTATEKKTLNKPIAEEASLEDMKEHPFLSESEKRKIIAQITELAIGKLGATDGEDLKKKVMEATNLAFIDANLVNIAEELSKLPERS